MDCANPYEVQKELGSSPFSVVCLILEILWITEFLAVIGANGFALYQIKSGIGKGILCLLLISLVSSIIFLLAMFVKKKINHDKWIRVEACYLLVASTLSTVVLGLIKLSS